MKTINCSYCRIHGVGGAPYLVILHVHSTFFSDAARCLPSADAVVDDFGTLVIVGGLF